MIKKMMKRWAFARAALRACFTSRIRAFNEAMDYRSALQKALGLASDSTDEEIAAALAEVEKTAAADPVKKEDYDAAMAEKAKMEEKLTATNSRVAELEKTVKANRMIAINAAVQRGVTAGVILPASIGAETATLEAAPDLAAAIEGLEKRAPVFNTRPLGILQPMALASVPETVAGRISAFNSAVNARREELKCNDADAVKAVKADPRFAGLVKAIADDSTPKQ